MLAIYIAAPLALADKCETLAGALREAGHRPVSSWHRQVTRLGLTIDPSDPVERRRVLEQNLSDLDAADLVLAYTAEGSPRTTYFEIGAAVTKGKRVLWCVGDRPPLCDAHPLVTRVGFDADLVAEVQKIADEWAAIEAEIARVVLGDEVA